MNSYELSRAWFDWSFENPEKVKPIHTAIYFFAIEHSNRLGWKEKFGFPSQMVMDAIGVKKFQTYGKALHDLSEWGFIEFIEKSKNQYSANIIRFATPKNGKAQGKAQGKALDKAFIKHRAEHGHSTGQSTGHGMDSIDKPINKQTIIYKGEDSEKDSAEVYSEKIFLERWKDARMNYDKKPTNITKLKTNDRLKFNDLSKSYGPKDFDHAIAGLFYQNTYPATRIQPTHFLNDFETYLDCWRNKTKLFEDKGKKKLNGML